MARRLRAAVSPRVDAHLAAASVASGASRAGAFTDPATAAATAAGAPTATAGARGIRRHRGATTAASCAGHSTGPWRTLSA